MRKRVDATSEDDRALAVPALKRSTLSHRLQLSALILILLASTFNPAEGKDVSLSDVVGALVCRIKTLSSPQNQSLAVKQVSMTISLQVAHGNQIAFENVRQNSATTQLEIVLDRTAGLHASSCTPEENRRSAALEAYIDGWLLALPSSRRGPATEAAELNLNFKVVPDQDGTDFSIRPLIHVNRTERAAVHRLTIRFVTEPQLGR